MADDYGALVMLDLVGAVRGDVRIEVVNLELFEAEFAAGRDFGLVAQSGAS